MTRTLLAALLTAGGMISAAQAQFYYHSPSSYTSYYAPASYSNYSYTNGYGPLSVFDARWWTGSWPYTTAYAPSYTSYYSATPAYTASYSPLVTTSYYDTTAAVVSPTVLASNSCCTPCCAAAPCGSCSSCVGGTCASGTCAQNYSPVTSPKIAPQADPAMSGSSGTGSSGSRTFESESGNGGSTQPDGYQRSRPGDDGFNSSGSRESGYGPSTTIQQKAPAPMTEDEPEAGAAPDGGAGTPDATANPDARHLDLDTRITSAPSLVRERARMKARFGSPQLARAKVDPSRLPAAADLRLVQK